MTSVPDASPVPLAEGTELALATSWPTPDVAVVRAVGEIDLITAPAWADALERACADLAGRAGSTRLVCDLSGVEFLSARGVSVLVDTAARAAAAAVELRLVVTTRPVRRVLEATGMTGSFVIDSALLDARS